MILRALLFVSIFISSTIPTHGMADSDFSEKVNLALRATAHNLLKEEGDSTSTIPIVKNNGTRHSLKLPKLNYDLFPYAFQDALNVHHVDHDYRVLIYKCGSEDIVLGYHSRSLQQKNVTCQGRELENGCYEVVVHFDIIEEEQSYFSAFAWPTIFIILISIALLLRKKRSDPRVSESNNHLVNIGSYTFDAHNQNLHHPNFKKQLTYRENKLLTLLVKNKNQVVKREQIHDQVWGEEGVIVGRSLDVFISRLRKYLDQDESVSISNIHGVGYKLEVLRYKQKRSILAYFYTGILPNTLRMFNIDSNQNAKNDHILNCKQP